MKLKSTAKFFLGAILPLGLQAQTISQSAAFRFLQQASWGPTPASIAQVQQNGYAGYLSSQLTATLSPITDVPVDMVKGTGPILPARNQFFYNAATGQDQLRQRMVFALGQIFVVSTDKINTPNSITNLQRIFQQDAFGNFRDLMNDVTLSPAMGRYLDMVNSVKPVTGAEADQNYARELMQLFTIGLTQFTGTNAGQPTYGPVEVDGFARAFTGWKYGAAAPDGYTIPMIAVDRNHDMATKTLLTYNGATTTLPANQSALTDLTEALDNIFNHPNVGPFIALRLIQHFVTSTPSQDYVNRVATVFNGNGGTTKRGDLWLTIQAVLLDNEARAGDSAPPPTGEGHLMEPILALMQYVRETGATVAASNNLVDSAAALEQLLFGSPSVFNFYSPFYFLANPPVNAPEFQILTTADAVNRNNTMSSLVYNKVVGVTNNLSQYDTLAANSTALLNKLNTDLMGGTMPMGMQGPITTYMNTFPAAHDKVLAAVYLITSSWQWQVAR